MPFKIHKSNFPQTMKSLLFFISTLKMWFRNAYKSKKILQIILNTQKLILPAKKKLWFCGVFYLLEIVLHKIKYSRIKK